jgi:di/tricarboxylate transporter
VAVVLFVTEWVRMDLVALMCLGAVALTGLVTPKQALAGFSNPAVITVWAMFMLSAGLTHTGVAALIGRRVLDWAGHGEARMAFVIMLTAGGLSAFMNNIGVAALMLPVVMDIARQTRRPPSRLLMPLAYGSLLGGLTTMVGTPPNLLVSDALREFGYTPFGLFDFTPVGVGVALAGIVFVAFVGRRMLPVREAASSAGPEASVLLQDLYRLGERAVAVRVTPGSLLVGKTLRQSRLGSAAGLNVFGVKRNDRTIRAPEPDFVLRTEDRLLVEGRLDRFNELQGWRELEIEVRDPRLERMIDLSAGLAQARVSPGSSLVGQSLRELDFRHRFGVIVLAIQGSETVRYYDLANARLGEGDRLLLIGERDSVANLAEASELASVESITEPALRETYRLEGRLFTVHIPEESILIGKTLSETRIGDAFGLGVLGLIRQDETLELPDPSETLEAGDRLLIRGEAEELNVLRGLQQLEIVDEDSPILDDLESERTGLIEVVLAPRTTLVGKTLREISFREKFGLRVLAIQREGRSIRSNLRDTALRFGDALLLLGPREKQMLLGAEPDFLVLTQAVQKVPRTAQAPLAAAIMLCILVPVMAGWLPIAIAGIVGATLMVLSGCLTMDEAYRSVSWRSIFLIAAMLPLGTALQTTGAATFVAQSGVAVLSPFGVWGVVIGLYLVTSVATMIIPTAALVVIMAPIAITSSTQIGLSPSAAMMAVAIAASASFTSPIAHPANVLVMGPGGYRFIDYVKVGVPLTIVVMIVALILLPFVWPF